MNEPQPDPNSVGLMLRMLGYSYYKLGDLNNARRYQVESIQKYHPLGDFLCEHWTRLELGYTLQALGEIDQALAEYDRCLKYAKHIRGHQIEEWVNVTLAKISISQGNLSSAKTYLEASQSLVNNYENSLEDQITLEMTWADYYFACGETAQIPAILEDITKLLNSYHADQIRAKLLSMYGRYYHMMGDFKQACEYFEQSLAICTLLHACIPTAITCHLLCKAYMDLGNPDEAETYTRMAKENLAAVHSPWSIDDLEVQMIEWIY
jgi:ATP/maltotriose-dependent transcriptional regulator MalT